MLLAQAVSSLLMMFYVRASTCSNHRMATLPSFHVTSLGPMGCVSQVEKLRVQLKYMGKRSGRREWVAAELRELNRIGVNLNQMARPMNSGASAPAGTQKATERVGELVAGVVWG